jgi:hypothetical protein
MESALDFSPIDPEKKETTLIHRQKCTCSWWWVWLIIAFLVVISIAGPWYQDCGRLDCTRQRDYGIYCDDYCIYGHYGPGTSTGGSIVILFFFGLLLWVYPFNCGSTIVGTNNKYCLGS